MFLGAIGATFIRAQRWKYLLAPIKKDVSYKNMFSTILIGYMMNNLIPRSGEVARPVIFGKQEGISKAAAFGTVLMERIIDTVTFLLMFGVCLIFFKGRITNAFPEMNTAVIILSVLSFLLMIWVIFTMFKTELSLKIIKFFSKVLPKRFQDKIDKIFVSLIYGFEFLRKPDLVLKIIFYSILIWIVYIFATFIPFYSFDILVNHGSFWESLWDANLLLVLINVSMFVPAPAGTGPYHYICLVTLTTIFSIDNAKALGYGTATHAMGFLIYLIFGLYYFIVSNYKFSELKEKSITNG